MKLLILLLSLLACPAMAGANERLREAAFSPTQGKTPFSLQLKNQAVLQYLWFDVYAAAFYSEAQTTPAQAVKRQTSQRLELYYFHDIAREDVIKAAWTTLHRQQSASTLQGLQAELDRLHSSFQNIKPGDRYALVYNKDQGLRLERNGSEVFASPNHQLAQVYFGIWLAPEGLSDELREALLAER